jgi:ribosome-binding protein aMBF1 (putative translation factor)
MPKTLDEYLKGSKRANAPEVLQKRAVFERSYTIAMQLAELREKQGLTQLELASRTGIPQSQISRIEHGSISPTASTLARLADALGADLRLVERHAQAV